MKLLRHGPKGQEKPALLHTAGTLPVVPQGRLAVPWTGMRKFIAIGLNYADHEYQLERGGTWDKGKGCDTFGPIGPWLVSADEVGAPHPPPQGDCQPGCVSSGVSVTTAW